VGTSVSYTFQSVGHNVTFNAVAGAPPSILGTNMNTTIAVTFATAGTFPYQCTIHPGMTGTVTVQ
jgi:plastocyanin